MKKGFDLYDKLPIYEVETTLSWPVYEEYRISNDRITKVSNKIKREYDPLKTFNLFQEFAQMFSEIPPAEEGNNKSQDNWLKETEKAILKWVSKYGMLHYLEPGVVDNNMLDKFTINYYRKKISKANEALYYYHVFQDLKAEGHSDINDLKIYQDTLILILEEAPLQNIKLAVRLDKDSPELLPAYIPNDLLEALWLQFWKTVTGGDRLRQCKRCGRLFVIPHERQLYCPGDKYNNYKSACGNASYQWVHRNKKKAFKLFDQGNNIETVTMILSQEKKPIKATKIQEWFSEWNNDKKARKSSQTK